MNQVYFYRAGQVNGYDYTAQRLNPFMNQVYFYPNGLAWIITAFIPVLIPL